MDQADIIFGATVASTGFFGTAIGGVLLDRKAKSMSKAKQEDRYV